MNYDDVRNRIEGDAEEKFPGYVGVVWGQYTPGKEVAELPRRTQVAFEDGAAYWLDVPPGAVLSGDMIAIMERGIELRGIKKDDRPKVTVAHVGMTMPGEYFERKDAVPHKLGTFVELHRKVENARP